jgi:hypothetical protein
MAERLSNILIGLDRYGIPLTLNYKDKSSYKTRLGTFLTLIQYAFLSAYLAYQIQSVLERSDVKIFSHESFLGNDPATVNKTI